MIPRILLFVTALLTIAGPGSGQTPPPPGPDGRHHEEGRPFVRTYGPVELGGDSQNWAVVQDQRGVIYVGSASGVLEFDGATWRLIELPTLNTVRSLAIDDSGRIYVGAVREFGYLAPNDSGAMAYVSLRDRLPAAAPDFRDVWRTHVTASGVVFQTEQAIFRWANDAIQVIAPTSYFNRSSVVDGEFYAVTPELGLSRLDGATLRPLPGTESLGREIYPVILRYDTNRLLIGTRTNGLFLYDGATLAPFATDVDAWTRASSLYRGLVLPDGHIALASTSGGVAIIDHDGRATLRLTQDRGLPSNSVYNLMMDREGALWLTLDAGIARVETPSPATFFDLADGFTGQFNSIRHEGRLYLAGQTGVSYLHDAVPGSQTRLSPVAGIANQCWWFAAMSDPSGAEPLTVACTDGLYEIRGTSGVPLRVPGDGTYRAAFLARSTVDPSRLWVGMFDGLASFRRVDGRWIDEGRVDSGAAEVRAILENPDGSLWLGTASTGVARLRFATTPAPGAPRPAVAATERFGVDQGLPGGGIFVIPVAGQARFLPWSGGAGSYVAHFDEGSRTFVRDTAFETLESDRLRGSFGLAEAPGGELYANFGKGTAILRRGPDGALTIDRERFSRFGREPTGLPLIEPDGVVWFNWKDRFVRFDLSHASPTPVPFPALIRSVTANQDRPLFSGAGAVAAPTLPATDDALRFDFAAPSFLDETTTEYQSKLDGLDREWSPWTREARRDYTNLGFGTYTFRVRARNVAGGISDDAVYPFTILRPWYRTWWAYAGYLLMAALAAFGIDRLQRRRLLQQERARAQLMETRLRAESAEALARSESEGKKNVELLSGIGREITASLDIDTIFGRLYDRVNELADADVFGVGLYHPELHQIEYRLAIEEGKRYAPYSRDTTDRNQLPVWCIEHGEPIFINDLAAEFGRYIASFDENSRQLEDGSMSRQPQSLIYMPLVAKERVLGIITIQSFEKQAYTQHHLNVVQGLAAYTAIALDNAAAYRQLNEQEHEIRRLFEEAERARSVAEEADAAKSAFLSTVSHELRTPLTSVLGFAKIIKKRLEDRIFPLVPTDDRKVVQTIRQVGDNLTVVVSEGERLTKLIDDVLDLAKIEAGKLEWHMEPVTADDVIERATAATASLLEPRGLRLVKEVAPGLPPVVGDRDRLIQVVINLISNAVKFTEAGVITCRASRQGDQLIVSVTDTGVGIAPADQPKVFERFKQVGDTLTDKPKGTGLGLPICREIVDHHGGRIWVESEPGRGSTFAFALPLAPGERPDTAAAPLELAALIRQLRDRVTVTTPRTAERTPRILVVDVEAIIRELLTQEFTEAGYQVSVASHGREALALVRRERPDLVVLDVMMPEMNGFDVAAVLKNDPLTADIPIVILSIVQDRERGVRIGVDRYLTKPIDTDLLFREVGTLIEQKASHKRVLVVDEDASTVKTLTDVLTTRGYTVSEARGEDLIARALAVRPDIIMLNSVSSARSDAVQMLRFEKGMDNVLFLVYQ